MIITILPLLDVEQCVVICSNTVIHITFAACKEIFASSFIPSEFKPLFHYIPVLQIVTEIGRVFTRGQFWHPGIVVACVCVYQSLACPHDNSSPVQAWITKFDPEKQNTLDKILIVLGGNWPWPSRSNLTSNSKLTPFWACPNHYSPPILVRISKFGQQMHFSTVRSLLIWGVIDRELHPHF